MANRYYLCVNRIVGVFFLCIFYLSGTSQQLPKVYNQFFMNPYVYNPAYAGVEGHAVAFVTYKKQWVGINGAPTMMNANFHVPLKGGLAIGGLAYNETAGLFSQNGGKISAGYLISIDREHFLRLGLSLGAGNNTLNFGEFDSPNDPAFADLVDTETFFLGDFGFTYHFGHFNVGAALPSLFSYDLFTDENGGALGVPIRVSPQDHVLFKLNYRGHIGHDLAIEPHLIYRYNKYLKDQYEGTVILHLLHIVWVGGTYRQDAGFVGLLGIKLFEKIGVGYAYEYGNPEIASLAGPSHEIHLGYHIGTRKQHAEHVSSFIKSHRLSAEERAKQAELERQRKLQELQRSRQAAAQQSQPEDELSILDTKKPEPEKVAGNWSYEQVKDPVERVNKFGETERGIKFDRLNEKGKKEVVFSWLPPPPPGTTDETFQIANPAEEPLIRTRPDGSREAGIKWKRTLDNGKTETLIIWDEIMTEEEAGRLDTSPSVTMSMEDAKISIRRETPVVDEEPVQEEPVLEEPIEETPVVQEEIDKGDTTLTKDFRTHEELANSNEPLEVKRGGHLLELPEGNYVVAGVFENLDNADSFSDTLFRKGFKGVKVGYLTARGYYYVVIYRSDSFLHTVQVKNQIKNSKLSEVWVLKVSQ